MYSMLFSGAGNLRIIPLPSRDNNIPEHSLQSAGIINFACESRVISRINVNKDTFMIMICCRLCIH